MSERRSRSRSPPPRPPGATPKAAPGPHRVAAHQPSEVELHSALCVVRAHIPAIVEIMGIWLAARVYLADLRPAGAGVADTHGALRAELESILDSSLVGDLLDELTLPAPASARTILGTPLRRPP